MTAPRRRWVVIAAVIGVLAIGARTLPRAIAGWIAVGELRERGIVCAPLSLSVAWDLSSVEVARARCRPDGGALEEIALERGAHVVLEDRRPVSIDAREIALRMRAPAGAPAPIDARALLAGEVPPPIRSALEGLATLARRRDLPRTHVARALVHGLGSSIDVEGIDLTPREDGFAIAIERAGPPAASLGPASLGARLSGITGEASGSRVEIRGTILVEAAVRRGAIARGIRFRLSGDAIDGPAPRYALWIEGSEQLEALRATAAALAERRRAIRDGELEPGARLRERVRELRERTDALREEGPLEGSE